MKFCAIHSRENLVYIRAIWTEYNSVLSVMREFSEYPSDRTVYQSVEILHKSSFMYLFIKSSDSFNLFETVPHSIPSKP